MEIEVDGIPIEIMSEQGEYWLKRKEDSEKMLEGLYKDLEQIPFHINFHENIIELAESKIKELEE